MTSPNTAVGAVAQAIATGKPMLSSENVGTILGRSVVTGFRTPGYIFAAFALIYNAELVLRGATFVVSALVTGAKYFEKNTKTPVQIAADKKAAEDAATAKTAAIKQLFDNNQALRINAGFTGDLNDFTAALDAGEATKLERERVKTWPEYLATLAGIDNIRPQFDLKTLLIKFAKITALTLLWTEAMNLPFIAGRAPETYNFGLMSFGNPLRVDTRSVTETWKIGLRHFGLIS